MTRLIVEEESVFDARMTQLPSSEWIALQIKSSLLKIIASVR